MTDISTTAPISIRRLSLSRLCFPRLEIGASLTSIPGLMSDALSMAYVDPYTGLRHQPQVVLDDDPEARDPNW